MHLLFTLCKSIQLDEFMRPAGEDLVPEPQNEVEELQREGELVLTAAHGATDGLEPIRTSRHDTRDTHSPVHRRALQR